jgi:hypothetical protein
MSGRGAAIEKIAFGHAGSRGPYSLYLNQNTTQATCGVHQGGYRTGLEGSNSLIGNGNGRRVADGNRDELSTFQYRTRAHVVCCELALIILLLSMTIAD